MTDKIEFLAPTASGASQDYTGIEVVFRKGIAFQRTPSSVLPASDTVIVDSNGTRFVANGFRRPFHVEEVNRNAPPNNPVTGDSYIVGPAPTGAWAGHANDVATWISGWSWQFIDMSPQMIGFDILNLADGLRYQYTNAGWSQGVVADGITFNTLDVNRLLNPAAIIVSGVYDDEPAGNADFNGIVSANPSGAFAGRNNQVVYRRSGVLSFIPAAAGMIARDISADRNRTFNGTAWITGGINSPVIGYDHVTVSPGEFKAPGQAGNQFQRTATPVIYERVMEDRTDVVEIDIDPITLNFDMDIRPPLQNVDRIPYWVLQILYGSEVVQEYRMTGGFWDVTGGRSFWRVRTPTQLITLGEQFIRISTTTGMRRRSQALTIRVGYRFNTLGGTFMFTPSSPDPNFRVSNITTATGAITVRQVDADNI